MGGLLLILEGRTARNSRFLEWRMTAGNDSLERGKKNRVTMTVNRFLRRETGSKRCEKHDRKERKMKHVQRDNESKEHDSDRHGKLGQLKTCCACHPSWAQDATPGNPAC